MTFNNLLFLTFSTLLLATSCEETKPQNTDQASNPVVNLEQEKSAILETLNKETKAAFQRDL